MTAPPANASMLAASGGQSSVPSPELGPEHAQVVSESMAPVRDRGMRDEHLTTLFQNHNEMIWRTLRRLGATPEAAADFTQQAFVIAAERFERIRPGSEKAFLFATAIGLARTSRRREQRCVLEPDMAARIRGLAADDPSTTHYARQVMNHILAHLSADMVTVFTLYELEELSTAEIAERLGLPLGTVASRLRRARVAFRHQVALLEGDESGEKP